VEVYSNLLIVAMILAISYLIYSQAPRPSPSGRLVYNNSVHMLFGSPSLALLGINSTGPDVAIELDVDQASSKDGILSLEGTSYVATQSLCTANGITFFSVLAPLGGELTVNTTGDSWVDGHMTRSIRVDSGWHELIISHTSTCGIVLPDGRVLSSITTGLSTIPMIGQSPSSVFRSYLPLAGAPHHIQIVFGGGIDSFDL